MQEHTTITPHLTCRDAKAAVDFYKKAFGAEAPCVITLPNGQIMHAEILIDGAAVYLVEENEECGGMSPQSLGGSPVTMHLKVADCDAIFARAVESGCTPVMPLEDMFWGDRFGVLVDPFGHKWAVATPKRLVSPDEIQRAMAGMAAASA